MKSASSVPTARLASVARHMSAAAASTSAGTSSGSKDASSSSAPVRFESAYGTRTMILNEPKRLNTLNQVMIDLMAEKVANWDKSEQCGVVVSMGEGRAYCAGGDVVTVIKVAQDEALRPTAINFFKTEFDLMYNLATLSKPYVSIMDGFTMGGGAGLSAWASSRIATPKTVWAMPETKIGYSPDVGVSYVLGKLDGEVGTYLGLTGNTINGEEAFRLGLATHFVPEVRIESLRQRLGEMDMPSSEEVAATIEEFSEDIDNVSLGIKAGAPPSVVVGAVREALDDVFSAASVEAIFHKIERYSTGEIQCEEPARVWAKSTLETLRMRSPTSLKVTLASIRKAQSSKNKLEDSFTTELAIATAYCSLASPDFVTGVTTLLVDKKKDVRPQWDPAQIQDVDNEWVKKMFFPSPSDQPTPWGAGKSSSEVNLSAFALPTEAEIRGIVFGDGAGSSSGAVTLDELIDLFERRKDGKKGVKAKIEEVVSRRCQPTRSRSDYLRWIY